MPTSPGRVKKEPRSSDESSSSDSSPERRSKSRKKPSSPLRERSRADNASPERRKRDSSKDRGKKERERSIKREQRSRSPRRSPSRRREERRPARWLPPRSEGRSEGKDRREEGKEEPQPPSKWDDKPDARGSRWLPPRSEDKPSPEEGRGQRWMPPRSSEGESRDGEGGRGGQRWMPPRGGGGGRGGRGGGPRPNEADRRDREANTAKRIQDFRKRKRAEDEGSQEFAWGKPGQEEEKEEEAVEKEKPNFGTSGKLAEDTNKFNGIVVSYVEPPEAKRPKLRWRLYPFKEDEPLPVLYVHRQSAYLIGRDRRVADIPVDHPSCSKQHAALQYRLVPSQREDGTRSRTVKPYVIDLASANGTFLNNNKIDAQRYYELVEKDVLKFGFSSREYVVLNEYSAGVEDEEGATPPAQDPPIP